jgi:hypothetical protein
VSEPTTGGGETASELVCPHCGQAVAFIAAETAQRLACPHCGGEFVAPAADGSTDLPDSPDSPDPDALPGERRPRQDELNALHIKYVAAERRALYRARSWHLIGAGVCAGAAAQLVWMIVQRYRAAGWGLQCSGYLLFALLACNGVGYFLLRAWRTHREAKRSALTEPLQTPDFSTLGDGGDRAHDLEDVM